ncbi:MAG: DUF4398 domain-containing protein [Polyangiaceae bacterium]|nr:DUF4398 domain-containing protein [Polyangiaceae bacterium]
MPPYTGARAIAMKGITIMMRNTWPLLLPLLVACGGAPPPNDQMAKTEAEIRAAQVKLDELRQAGPSDGTPKVELHLKLASDQVAEAKKLIADKDMDRAELVLLRAEKDAQYALNLAQEWEARARAEAKVQEVNELREKMVKP